jgi:hypothetical protein
MAHKLSLNFPFAVVTIFTSIGSYVFTTPLAYWKLKELQSYAGQPRFVKKYTRTPLIQTLVTRIVNYPDQLGPLVKFVENSKQPTCPESTGYRFKYSAVLWLLELQIRRGRKVQTQLLAVNSNSRTANCQCSLFSKKRPVIRIFCISEWFAVPINRDKWSSCVIRHIKHGRLKVGGHWTKKQVPNRNKFVLVCT